MWNGAGNVVTIICKTHTGWIIHLVWNSQIFRNNVSLIIFSAKIRWCFVRSLSLAATFAPKISNRLLLIAGLLKWFWTDCKTWVVRFSSAFLFGRLLLYDVFAIERVSGVDCVAVSDCEVHWAAAEMTVKLTGRPEMTVKLTGRLEMTVFHFQFPETINFFTVSTLRRKMEGCGQSVWEEMEFSALFRRNGW